MKFRLATIAYVFALLAAGMAAFGVWGILIAAWVGATWACIAGNSNRLLELWLSLSFASLVLGGLLIPGSMGSHRGVSSRNSCLNNMKQILLALNNYESAHGAYPPPYVADADGKAMHSWRVLILPYLEHAALFKKYRMDEPWDGPNNRELWEDMPEVYRCPGCDACKRLGVKPFGDVPANSANYFAIVGENSAWSAATKRTRQELRARGADTLLVMEHTGKREPWTAPVDLTEEAAVSALRDGGVPGHPTLSDGWFWTSVSQFGRIGGTSDGHGRFLPHTMTEEQARAALAIGGADTDAWAEHHWRAFGLGTHWRYGPIYSVGLFVGLALWPGVGMWRRSQKNPPV